MILQVSLCDYVDKDFACDVLWRVHCLVANTLCMCIICDCGVFGCKKERESTTTR